MTGTGVLITGVLITLTDKERKEHIKLVKSRSSSARPILRANILLSSDASASRNLTVAETVELYHTTPTTVQTFRTAYAESGLEGVIYWKKRNTSPIPPKVDGNIEAQYHRIVLQ